MTKNEQKQIINGEHWLCGLADELNVNLSLALKSIQDTDKTPGEIALQWIGEHADNAQETQGAKFTVRCFPWEKKRILKAVAGEKVEGWIREAMIEKAFREEGKKSVAEDTLIQFIQKIIMTATDRTEGIVFRCDGFTRLEIVECLQNDFREYKPDHWTFEPEAEKEANR